MTYITRLVNSPRCLWRGKVNLADSDLRAPLHLVKNSHLVRQSCDTHARCVLLKLQQTVKITVNVKEKNYKYIYSQNPFSHTTDFNQKSSGKSLTYYT